jgi:hypothetical protein
MSTPNPHRGQNAAVLLNRTYIFAALVVAGGVAFLILALSGNLTQTVPRAPRTWGSLLCT